MHNKFNCGSFLQPSGGSGVSVGPQLKAAKRRWLPCHHGSAEHLFLKASAVSGIVFPIAQYLRCDRARSGLVTRPRFLP